MKTIKNRWENELTTALPALSDAVKNAEIPKKQSSTVTAPSSREKNMRRKIWRKRGFWSVVSGGVACAFAAAIILPNLSKGTGADASEMKVMNVSCNPSVEFVLSEENVVISANALNEEGNLVISAETFVGKTAEEAACLFVEIAQESGFIVSGAAELVGANNKITVAFSGDERVAEKLFHGIRGQIESYFEQNTVSGVIEQGKKVQEQEIEDVLAQCLPHIEKGKIQAMEYAELMQELADTRKETKDIYSQELKSAYYEMKAFAMEQAELEAVKASANDIVAAILDGAYTEYTKAVSEIETYRMEYLVDENSPYQQALTAFRAAKVEYLNYRNEVAQMELGEISQDILDVLAAYEETLQTLQEELLLIGKTANDNLNALKESVKGVFDSINESLQNFGIDKDAIAESIEEERHKAHEKFGDDFKTKREKEIGAAQDRWTEMKGELGKGKHQDGAPETENGEKPFRP